MNFSLNPGMVRGDLFTREGKWKYTVQIDMSKFYHDTPISTAVYDAYLKTPQEVRGVRDGATGYILVVLEPYHEFSHPTVVSV